MKVRARLVFPYSSPGQAEKVARSVRVDDDDYIATRVEGRTLVAEATSDSILSLLHTLDDYLACVAVSEKLLRRG